MSFPKCNLKFILVSNLRVIMNRKVSTKDVYEYIDGP